MKADTNGFWLSVRLYNIVVSFYRSYLLKNLKNFKDGFYNRVSSIYSILKGNHALSLEISYDLIDLVL